MRKTLLSFLAIFFCNIAFTQQFTLSTNTNTQIAYIGMDNQISCTVEGVNNKSIVLETDNGQIVKEQGNFIYRPLRVSDSKIIIYQKRIGQLKKIGEQDIMVREIPDPRITIGGYTEKEISKGQLLAQTGIGCYYSYSTGLCLTCRIDSFTIIVLRDSAMLFYGINKGNLFDDRTVSLFKSVQKGDIIIVSGITYTRPDQKRKNANLVEYVIQ